MTTRTLPNIDTRSLDSALLDEKGRIRLVSAAQWRAIPANMLAVWCHRHAYYGLPTIESVSYLKSVIDGRRAIEIGAGNGDLGFYLGIPQTDSYVQSGTAMKQAFAAMGQPPTLPKSDVLRMDATRAINHFQPQVVIASWVTRRFLPGVDEEGVAQAFIKGIDEEWIIGKVETYAHVGNLDQHGEKTALALPHETIFAPWLVSRATHQERNLIYIWTS